MADCLLFFKVYPFKKFEGDQQMWILFIDFQR